MKNARFRAAADLVLNILIVATTTWAVAQNFVGRSDVLFGNADLRCFRYFTTDSNVVAAIASLLALPWNVMQLKDPDKKLPRGLMIYKFATTVAVTLTLLTVVFFLCPTSYAQIGARAIGAFFGGDLFVLHFSTPVLAVLSAVVLERQPTLQFRHALWGLAPTVVYSAVYVDMVLFRRQWPDFYGFTFGGNPKIAPVSLTAMYLVTLAILWAEWRWRRGKRK